MTCTGSERDTHTCFAQFKAMYPRALFGIILQLLVPAVIAECQEELHTYSNEGLLLLKWILFKPCQHWASSMCGYLHHIAKVICAILQLHWELLLAGRKAQCPIYFPELFLGYGIQETRWGDALYQLAIEYWQFSSFKFSGVVPSRPPGGGVG